MDETFAERNSRPTPVPEAMDCPDPQAMSLTEILELPAGPCLTSEPPGVQLVTQD